MATWRAPKKTRITRSPPQPECQTRTEWAGILTDQHLWPGQPVLADLRFVQMTAFYSAETPPPVWFPDRNCASVCRSAARNQSPKGVVRAESLFFRGCDLSASTTHPARNHRPVAVAGDGVIGAGEVGVDKSPASKENGRRRAV
jgi:hypothetical protein